MDAIRNDGVVGVIGPGAARPDTTRNNQIAASVASSELGTASGELVGPARVSDSVSVSAFDAASLFAVDLGVDSLQRGLTSSQKAADFADRAARTLELAARNASGEAKVAGLIDGDNSVREQPVADAAQEATSLAKQSASEVQRALTERARSSDVFGDVLPKDWPAQLGELDVEGTALRYSDPSTGVELRVPAQGESAANLLSWAATRLEGLSAFATDVVGQAEAKAQIATENRLASSGAFDPSVQNGEIRDAVLKPESSVILQALGSTRGERLLELLG